MVGPAQSLARPSGARSRLDLAKLCLPSRPLLTKGIRRELEMPAGPYRPLGLITQKGIPLCVQD